MLLRAHGPLREVPQLQNGLAIFSQDAVWVGRGDSASSVNSLLEQKLDTATDLCVRTQGSEVRSSRASSLRVTRMEA